MSADLPMMPSHNDTQKLKNIYLKMADWIEIIGNNLLLTKKFVGHFSDGASEL